MNFNDEIKAVEELGSKIGYGNLMHIASALWSELLESKGTPKSGAFIPVIEFSIKKNEMEFVRRDTIRYEKYIKNYRDGKEQ